jgi:colanic acid biosynthesis glycosyl transferase WcaI
MKNLFILTERSFFLQQIAEGLSQQYAVQVIEIVSGTDNSKPLQPNTSPQKVQYTPCKGTAFDRQWLPGRIINTLTSAFVLLWKACWLIQSQDMILVVTNPPLLPFFALLIKFLKRCQFVLLVYDVYPEVLIATGMTTKTSLISRIFRAFNQRLCREAAQIITVGRDISELIAQRLPANAVDKIHYIPNWAETEIIHPTAKSDNALLQELDIVDRFVVLYAGNMGRTHDVEIIAAAAKQMATSHPQVQFVLIGAGARKQWLIDFVNANQLDNINVLPFRPYSEKNVSLNAGDIGIISYLPGMAGVSVPSRMYNQFAAGKPIIGIADGHSELATVLEEEAVGWVVSPQNLTQLITIIETASQSPKQLAQMGQRAARLTTQKYTYENTCDAYAKVIAQAFLPPQTPRPIARSRQATQPSS